MKIDLVFLFLFIFLIGCTSSSPEEEINAKLMEADNYINNSQFDKAENIYNELIEKYPDYAAPYVYKGAFLYEYKDDKLTAEKLFEISIQKKDAGYDGYQWLGLIANNKGQYTKAINYLEKSLEIDDTQSLTYAQAAIAYMDSNQIDKGRQYAKKAMDMGLDKKNKRILLSIMVNISAENINSEPKITEGILDDVIREDQTIGDAYVVKGITSLNKRDYTNAQKYYEAALEKEPKNPNAYARLCELFYSKREFLKSVEYCEQALNIDNKKSLAYYYSALNYAELGNYQKAADSIEDTLELDPDDPEKQVAAGQIYIIKAGEHAKKNETEQMAQALLRSIEFNRDQTPIEAYWALANYYYDKTDGTNAKKFIDLAIEKTNKLDNVQQRRYIEVYEKAKKIYANDLGTIKQLDAIIEKLKPTDETKDLPVKAEVFEKYSYVNKTIYLVPMDVDKNFALDLATILNDKFKFKFEVLEVSEPPMNAYNSLRNQYYVEIIEGYLKEGYDDRDNVFAITSKDITAETTNYVFGNSDGKTGVVSYYRFTGAFNNEPENESELFKRIGKANGLSTAENPKCALAYPHSFDEFKRKEPIFCGTNQEELKTIYKDSNWIDATPEEIEKIDGIYKKYGLER